MINKFSFLDPNKKYVPESLLMITTLLWGATFVVVKESLNDISPMLFITYRFMFASVFLIPIYFKKKQFFNRHSVKAGFILGLFYFLGFASQTVGLKYTTATKSGFLTTTSIIMVPFLQKFIKKVAPGKGAVIGTVFVLIGIFLLSSGGTSVQNFAQELGSDINIGDFLTLLCAFFFSFYIIFLSIETEKYDTGVLLIMQIITTAVLAIISTFLFDWTSIETIKFEWTGNLMFGIFYTAIFTTLITTALLTKYQKYISPTKAGLIYSFEPIYAAILAFFILNEKISNFGFVGIVLVMTGLFFAELYDSRDKNGAIRIES